MCMSCWIRNKLTEDQQAEWIALNVRRRNPVGPYDTDLAIAEEQEAADAEEAAAAEEAEGAEEYFG